MVVGATAATECLPISVYDTVQPRWVALTVIFTLTTATENIVMDESSTYTLTIRIQSTSSEVIEIDTFSLRTICGTHTVSAAVLFTDGGKPVTSVVVHVAVATTIRLTDLYVVRTWITWFTLWGDADQLPATFVVI